MHVCSKIPSSGVKDWIILGLNPNGYSSRIDLNSDNKIFLVGQTQSNLDNATF